MGLFSKIFGSYSDHQIKKIKKYADQIEALREIQKYVGRRAPLGYG